MTRKIPNHVTHQMPSDNATLVDSSIHQPLIGDTCDISTIDRKMTYAIHTSLLFDPHQKTWLTNVSVQVDKQTGLIISIYERAVKHAVVEEGDLDLRAYTVLPGFGKCL